jgi:hypothetical protein
MSDSSVRNGKVSVKGGQLQDHVTPAVSRAFAELPVRCGDAFSDAVQCVEPFLVPFETWSLLHYGLYGSIDGQPRISVIDSAEKGRALLRLLDKTISENEGAIVPSDLSAALGQIAAVLPRLTEDPAFRRLSAQARR